MAGLLQKFLKRSVLGEGAKDAAPTGKDRCAELKKHGNSLLAAGELYEASQCYRAAALADPEDASALVNLGYALSEQKRFFEAKSALDQAVILDPAQFDAHFMLGTLAQQEGNMSVAIYRFREVLRLRPDFELAYRELGYELFRNGQTADAEAVIREGVRRFPQSSDLLCNLGNIYSVLNQPLQAIEAYQRALILTPRNSRIIGNMGAAYDLLGNREKANELMLQSLKLDPSDMDIQSNLALNLWASGRYEEALKCFHATLSLDPNHGLGHMNLGLASLLLGDFERGWSEYEWRFAGNREEVLKARKTFTQPSWRGAESLAGKTILLHCEQGLGDTIQFCRYVPEVAARGAAVVLQVQRGLKELLKELPGITKIVEEGDPLPPFDVQCPLMSLVLALGHHRSAVIPPEEPYLRAETGRVAEWRQRLSQMGPGSPPRIGVVWSGNPRHQRDRHRSMQAVDLLRALPAGMNAVCLQPEVRESDLLAIQADARITYLGLELKNFTDTAALITALDLVITVDTSVAHLAGALGKPVWVMVTHVPDWRWLLDREDSVWYRSARIFRQGSPDDWSCARAEVHNALLQRYETASS